MIVTLTSLHSNRFVPVLFLQTEDEDDNDSGDESDDGFFVPHGYLSEDEVEGAVSPSLTILFLSGPI